VRMEADAAFIAWGGADRLRACASAVKASVD
jgi:hypothetical protein